MIGSGGEDDDERIAARTNPTPVLMGTCGWSGQQLAAWQGSQSASADSKKSALATYAEHWPAVEVNSSNYAIPSCSTVESWVAATPSASFTFAFKAFGLMTNKAVDPKALPSEAKARLNETQRGADRVTWDELEAAGGLELVWQAYNDALLVAYKGSQASGKYPTVAMFQFPLSFRPTVGIIGLDRPALALRTPGVSHADALTRAPPSAVRPPLARQAANLRHVLDCRRRLDVRCAMAVEFRDRAWFVGDAKRDLDLLKRLRDRGIAMVHADELLAETFPSKNPRAEGAVHKVLPISLDVTSKEFALVRIHRRTGVESRRLSEAEIARWRDRLVSIASQLDDGAPIFVWWGTEHANTPLVNGMHLQQALAGKPGIVVVRPAVDGSRPKRKGGISRYFEVLGITRGAKKKDEALPPREGAGPPRR